MHAAEPTLTNVVYSLMFESPDDHVQPAVRSASACGSSRVLMIGRLRVVAELTPSQMCSARWAIEYIGPRAVCSTLPDAGEDLPADEERDQHLGVVAEVVGASGEVVLVTAVAVARRVGVVLEQVDRAADAFLAEALLGRHQQALEDPLARLVVHDEVVQRVAFRRRVLGVGADVEVQPGAVLQEHVAAATPRHHPPEQVAGDLVGAQPPLAAERARDAVFVLEAVDAALHMGNVARRDADCSSIRRCVEIAMRSRAGLGDEARWYGATTAITG